MFVFCLFITSNKITKHDFNIELFSASHRIKKIDVVFCFFITSNIKTKHKQNKKNIFCVLFIYY
jgi:hypothetical protein